MSAAPNLDNMQPQEMTRGDSTASNISDEIVSYLDADGSNDMDIRTLAKVFDKLGVMERGQSLDMEMNADFWKTRSSPPLNPNQVATKIPPPPANGLPPPLPIVGEKDEKPSRNMNRMDIPGGPGGAVGGMVANKLMPSPLPDKSLVSNKPLTHSPPPGNIIPGWGPTSVGKGSPLFGSRRKMGGMGRFGEATKTSAMRQPMPMLDGRPSPPIKNVSPPIGSMSGSSTNSNDIPERTREFLGRFGTEKRPSRRHLPGQKRKDSPTRPKEPSEEVKPFLKIVKDKLRDSATGPNSRPVYSTVRPIVCHYTNTPFYAQCSTAKLGWCTWCQTLRPGNQKQGSICLSCGERLTAKYHRWYPQLVRLEPLERERRPETYRKFRPLFEHYNIKMNDQKQFDFVIQHYMLMKIYLSAPEFQVDALHVERAYMIGVFAGREFNTGALARKLLREGCGLAMFRADFPEFFEVYLLREERASVAESMNQALFQGQHRAYFHAHHTNIEGWYDQNIVGREDIVQLFKDLCNEVLSKNAGAAFGPPMIPSRGPMDFGPQGQMNHPPEHDGPGGPPPGMPFLPHNPQHEPMGRSGPMMMGPMGSPITPMGPHHMFNGPPPPMLQHGGPHGPPPPFQPMMPPMFNPNGPNHPVRPPFMGGYGMPMVSPPGPPPPNAGYVPLPPMPQRGIPSVAITSPTPPPMFPNTRVLDVGGEPFDRQLSNGSSVSGATFVPHNPGFQGNNSRSQTRF